MILLAMLARSPALLAAVLTCVGAAHAAAPHHETRVFQHRKPPFRFTVPEGWQLSSQTGYPPLLLRLTRAADGAVVSLALGSPNAREELAAFVARNNQALREIGFRVRSSAAGQLIGYRGWLTAAAAADDARAILQLYLPHGRWVLIWTIVVRRTEIAAAKLELERMLENLSLR